MTNHFWKKYFKRMTVALCLFSPVIISSHPAFSSQLAVQEFQRASYEGNFSGGIKRLEELTSSNPEDIEAIFATGALQFFNALATLQQDFYAHNDRSAPTSRRTGMIGRLLPFRSFGSNAVLLPKNPSATPMTYVILRQIFTDFYANLAKAEATLAKVGEHPVKLPLQPFKVAIDLNHNGTIEMSERIVGSLLARTRRGRLRSRGAAFENATIAFDTADASWLRGYCNVLLATTNMLLAFDFERSYDVAAHNLYGSSATQFGQELMSQLTKYKNTMNIQQEMDKLDKAIKALVKPQSRTELIDIRTYLRALPHNKDTRAERAALHKRQRELYREKSKYYKERRTLIQKKSKLVALQQGRMPASPLSGIFDLAAYVHTMSWTVIEPERLKKVRTHLLQVMALNKQTWRLARSETDNDREWLPNAKQTAPFGADQLTDKVIDSWLATTALASQVLKGEKLLPHPRFTMGINLKKLFETAKRIDFLLLVTGHDAIPYLEEGDIVDNSTWRTITQPMNRNVSFYAIWFN